MKAAPALVLRGTLALAVFGCAFAQAPLYAREHAIAAAGRAAGDGELVYIGTWGSEAPPLGGAFGTKPLMADGPVGIYAARLDEGTGRLLPLGLQIPLQRADWLVANPKLPVLYSVAASSRGMHAPSDVYSLRIDATSGRLTVLDKVSSDGQDATTMALDDRSETLLVGNHGSGDVSALPVHADGSLASVVSLAKDYGRGLTARQKNPSAHGVAVDATHGYVFTADFGADRIFVYRLNAATGKLTPARSPFVQLPPGSGPRHLALSPDDRYLFADTELSGVVRSYRWEPSRERLHLVQTISPYPAGYAGEKTGGELAISRDGRFLYFSIRETENALLVYAIDRSTGTLRQIQRISARGQRPWSFAIDPSGRWMAVANMGSQSVVIFGVDPSTGRLSPTHESIGVPNPAAVAFYPE